MNAVVNRFAFTGTLIVSISLSTAAPAQFFSTTGRTGHYAEFFIEGVKESGVKNNKIANVIQSSNDNLKKNEEFVVNCNTSIPQVINGKDNTKVLDIRTDPSSADKVEWELWFAVCKKQFAKLSKRSADNAALKRLNDINNFDFDGLPYALRYTPTVNRHTLSNLVSASFDRLDQRRTNPLLIYCEPDNPTVHWVEFKKLVGVDDETGQDLNQGTEERLVVLSKEIWTKTCTQGQSNTVDEPNQPVGADRVTQQGKNLPSSEQAQPSSKEGTALKELYKHYIITSQICEFGFSSDSKLRPLKVKLKDADSLTKAHAVSVESVWFEAVKLAEQDTKYQLAQLIRLCRWVGMNVSIPLRPVTR